MKNKERWQSLLEFSFDEEGVAFSLSKRLARENHWSADFTARVLEEYRRFLYLCVEAGHPVTPSDEVDQAWHLHLCYTRSYWDELCGRVLKVPVHHGPTRGGEEEGRKFGDWYGATLDSYREQFGEEPPEDIWPPTSTRFRSARFERIDRSRNWVIPKFRPAVFLPALVILAAIGAGCANSGLDSASASSITGILLLAGLIVLIIHFSRQEAATPDYDIEKKRRRKASRNRGDHTGGCNASGGGCGAKGDDDGGNDGGGSSGCGGIGCGGGGCGGGD